MWRIYWVSLFPGCAGNDFGREQLKPAWLLDLIVPGRVGIPGGNPGTGNEFQFAGNDGARPETKLSRHRNGLEGCHSE